MQTAIFGGGCFWCVEAVFKRIRGVLSVESGYAGGSAESADYKSVCSGSTSHAEVIKIEYDEDVISYENLLEIFFEVHDPTSLNRQGADVGTQYRSCIFYEDETKKKKSQEFINKLDKSGKFKEKIVTTLEELTTFYKAESYHQNYFDLNPNQGYCAVVISPKVRKFEEKYQDFLKG